MIARAALTAIESACILVIQCVCVASDFFLPNLNHTLSVANHRIAARTRRMLGFRELQCS